MKSLVEYIKEYQEMIEQDDGYFANIHRNTLTMLFISLKRKCGDGEDVSLDYKYETGDKVKRFDIYVPNGIKKLNILPDTIIEVKGILYTDTLYRMRQEALVYKEWRQNCEIILIYDDKGSVDDATIRVATRDKLFRAYSLDVFLAKLKTIANVNEGELELEREILDDQDLMLDNAKSCFREKGCTLFLGAGVSQSAGGPSWRELLYKSLRKFHKSFTKHDFESILKECGSSAIVLGRYAVHGDIQKNILVKYLRNHVLYKNIVESDLIKSIIELIKTECVKSIVTYNYDDIVESYIEKSGIEVARIYSKSVSFIEEFPVYHVHGIIPQKSDDTLGIGSNIIFSEDEYHALYRESYNWSNVEQLHALDRTTCIFIGLSMTDPNLRRLLDISNHENNNEIRHFAFIKRIRISKDREKNKRNYRIISDQFASLGIGVLWYDNYDEIPEMLRKIGAELKLIG